MTQKDDNAQLAARRRRNEAGVSLIETLTAAGLLLYLAIGVLPMMTRALANNVRGREATVASSHARSHLEHMMQLPFDSGPLNVEFGRTELVTRAVWDVGGAAEGDASEGWTTEEPSSLSGARWQRISTVRQLNAADLETALDGNTPAEFVHLKEVQVRLEGFRDGPLGAGQRHTVRVLKAF